MIPVELLNTWGGAWFGLMTRTLVETCVLLSVILAVWLPLRRRISAQLAHGLFCLVLLKLIVPMPLSGSEWRPLAWWRQMTEGISAWAQPDQPSAPSAQAGITTESPWSLPATGDLGISLAEVASPQPVGTAFPSQLPDRTVARPPARADVVRTPAPTALSIQAFLMIVWASCAVIMLARFIGAMLRTRRLIRQAVPLCSEWLPIDLESLRRAVGLRTIVRWAVNDRLDTPAVGGLLRPSVIIPPDLNESLTPNQLTWVLLHELAHVRRGDLWVVVFQRVAQAVFFFNPAVHLANWIIDELREYACDDAALAACKTSRRDCGEGFLAIIERSAGRAPVAAPALGLFEGRMLIRRRLVRILDKHRTIHARLSRPAAFGLLFLALALVVLPYGASGNISAGPQKNLRSPSGPEVSLVERGTSTDEPASYRPGAVWHEQTLQTRGGAAVQTKSPNARAVVLAVAYSPDGTLLASAGDDAVIRLREVASGRLVGQLEGHKDAVSCVVFSPDGRTLATGSYDRTVKLWDVATRRQKMTLKGHTSWVFSVAFAPDGASLASGGHDKTVRIWDVGTGSEIVTLAGHNGSVRVVSFAPAGDDCLLASGGADKLVLVWSARSRALRARLEGHQGTVRALMFSPDGATLATGGEDGEVRLWNTNSGAVRAVLVGHSDMVTCLVFSPRGGVLATGSLDSSVKLWETHGGRERASLQGHLDGVSALAFAPDGRQMATAGFDGSVRLWEPSAPIFSPAACLAYGDELKTVSFSADGRTLRAAGSAGVASWDARTGSALPKVTKEAATTLATAPDGSCYATGGPDGNVVLFDAASDLPVAQFKHQGGNTQSVAFSPDSRLLASGDQSGVVSLWDVMGRRSLGALPSLGHPVSCVCFSPDGRTLAAGTGDEGGLSPGNVTIWDMAKGRLVATLEGHERGALAVAFSPDGATIASAGADGVIRLWESASRALRISLTYSGCTSLAFSPDGRVLGSAHESSDVVLWNARSGQQLGRLKGHRGQVNQVVFSPDGRAMATAGKDGTVKLWSLATRRQTARATLKRDQTLVRSVAYSPDGNTLAVADGPLDAGGAVTLWDLAARKPKAVLDGHERGTVAVVFSPDGTTLASGSCDGAIRIWDVATGTCRHELSGLSGITELAFSPDGRMLASAGEGNVVTLWDVETGAEAFRLTDLHSPVYSVAFSPDGTLLATGGGAGDTRPGARSELKIWDVAKQKVVTTLEGHTGAVLSVCFSSDGLNLASGGLDETIRVWDVKSSSGRLTMGGLSSCVQALAFSPDGRLLAWSGRSDGLVSLRDVATGAEVVRFVGHGALVRGIAFTPDGTGLATGGDDRTIKLWDVPLSEASLTLSATRSRKAHGSSR
jgi:WD40 repeat protein/beta-lactamase regulating signal transducer with metallopeptidase domain